MIFEKLDISQKKTAQFVEKLQFYEIFAEKL